MTNQEAADHLNNIYFIGRLANYKYFNMDQAFKNALDLLYKIEENAKCLETINYSAYVR